MKKKTQNHYIDTLAGLVLFGVFAACVVLALLEGAGAYRRLTARDSEAYDGRLCTRYVATKLQSAPSPAAVSVEGDALRIEEDVEGVPYASYIYFEDGWIREIFVPAGSGFDRAGGEKLMEAQGMRFALEDGLLRVTIETESGRERQLLYSLKEGAA